MERYMCDSWVKLKYIIDSIQTAYNRLTDLWLKQEYEKINLKRTLVSEIESDNDIYKNIFRYMHLLSGNSADVIISVCNTDPSKISARIKTKNSIMYKIMNYQTEWHEYGKIPINKCLNDLFGVRVILDSAVTFAQVNSFIKQEYGDLYRCVDSSKLDYIATHIYFKKDNFSFPWELQIWNECNRESNIASHARYKQGYTNWEQKNEREGGIEYND